MKKLISIFVILLFTNSIVLGSEIWLKNGKILKGKIIEESGDTITIKGEDWWKEIPKSEIVKIKREGKQGKEQPKQKPVWESDIDNIDKPINGRFKFKFGYSTLAMDEVNSDINDDIELLKSLGITMSSPDEINGNFIFGGELSVAISPQTAISFNGSYISDKTMSSYSDYSGSVSMETKVKSFNIIGNILIYPKIPDSNVRLYFGGGPGIAFVSSEYTANITFYDYPSFNVDGKSEFSGTGLVFNIRGGIEIPFDSTSSICFFLEAGYNFGYVGNLKGDVVVNGETISSNQEAKNNTEKPLEYDFSGLFFNAGIEF